VFVYSQAHSFVVLIRLNKNVKNYSLSTTYNGEMTHRKTAKTMNGDITSAAFCQCQRASKVISRFTDFAVFDVSFRRYKLQINYSFFYIYICCFIIAVQNVDRRNILVT